jgi:hypothetical protein
MLRFLVEVLVPLVVTGIAIGYPIAYYRLKRRVAGLKEPELWLPKRERRAYARKQLERRDEQYMEDFYRKMIDRPNPLKDEK